MFSPHTMVPRPALACAARARNLLLVRGSIAACLMASLTGCAQILGIDELSPGQDAGPDDGGPGGDRDGGEQTPPTPVPRLPMNGSRVGGLFLVDSRRPTFAWEATGNATYVLEYSLDAGFATGVTRVETTETSHRVLQDLPVSLAPPVGARYYWRVSACAGPRCSAPSRTWYFDLARGRPDVNGDGYDDVVVGAPEYPGAGLETATGAFHVYVGGPGATFGADEANRIVSQQEGEQRGRSLAMGDFDGDGFAEIVAGAPFYIAERGRFYVYAGSASAPGTLPAPVTADGPLPEVSFGVSLVTGDFNGDGFADLVAGDIGPGSNVDQVGHLSVFLGGPGGFDAQADVVLDGFEVGDGFGGPLARAGDVNGDGFDDLVAGVPSSQRVQIYFGGPELPFDDLLPAIVSVPAASDFGVAVAGAGDVDGDGYHDIVVGAPLSEAVFLYRGGPGEFDTVSDAAFTGTGGFGTSVSSAGDINGDGLAEVAIASLSNSAASSGVYLYSGDGLLLATLSGWGRRSTGGSLSEPADFNGDGVPDLVMSEGSTVGVLLGGDLSGPNLTELRSDSASYEFGFAIAP